MYAPAPPPPVEYRHATLRAEGDRVVSGTVVRYGDMADIGGAFREEIVSGALAGNGDVILNIFHDRTRPVAREGAGLTLLPTSEEFAFRAALPDTIAGNDAVEMVKNRLLTGASVEMRVQRDEWLNGGDHRIIRQAVVSGIALVDKPAYPQSSIDLRHAQVSLAGIGFERTRRIWL